MALHVSIFGFRVYNYDIHDTPIGNLQPIEEYTHPSLRVTFSGDQTRAIATPSSLKRDPRFGNHTSLSIRHTKRVARPPTSYPPHS